MFSKIIIPENNGGYVSKSLKHLINKEIKLSPNVNILFGPNGSGKSTIMRMLHNYSGYSYFRDGFIQPLLIPHRKEWFPKCLFGKEGFADIQWDGMPVSYSDGVKSFEVTSKIETEDSFYEHMAKNMASTGQKSNMLANSFAKEIEKTYHNRHKMPIINNMDSLNDSWKNLQKQWVEFINKNKTNKSDRITIMMDEPVIGGDLLNQHMMFEAFKRISTHDSVQFIIASHSIFALDSEVNLIITAPNQEKFIKECKSKLVSTFDKLLKV